MIGLLRNWFAQPAPIDARTQRMIDRQQRHAEEHRRYADRRARELRQARERFEASL